MLFVVYIYILTHEWPLGLVRGPWKTPWNSAATQGKYLPFYTRIAIPNLIMYSHVFQWIGITRHAWRIIVSQPLLLWHFRIFILALLYWCSHVWGSSNELHLLLFGCLITRAAFLLIDVYVPVMSHHRVVSPFCIIYKYFPLSTTASIEPSFSE